MGNKFKIYETACAVFVFACLAMATYRSITGDMLNAVYMVCLAVLGLVSVKLAPVKEADEPGARHWWHVTRSYNTAKGVTKFAASAVATTQKKLPAFALYLQTRDENDIADKDPNSQIRITNIAYLGFMTQGEFVEPMFEAFTEHDPKDLN